MHLAAFCESMSRYCILEMKKKKSEMHADKTKTMGKKSPYLKTIINCPKYTMMM